MRCRRVVLGCAIGLASLASVAAPPQYRIVDTKELPAYWLAQPGHEQRPPHYAADAVRAGVESCIEVGFSIDAAGVPGNFTVLRSVFTDGAAKDMVEALKSQATDAVAATRYAPAASNPQRLEVYTHRQFTFSLAESRHASKSEREAHAGHVSHSCRIDNFNEYADRSLKPGG